MKYHLKKSTPPSSIPFEELQVTHPNAAGIDVGAGEMWVAVSSYRDSCPIRKFGTFTVDLHAIADWLTSCGVDTVAIESTGVYWIPLFEVLEARGFEVYLVNARQVKNVPGRKTDQKDCEWLRKLHTFGLLSASFRPAAEVAELRELMKQRENLVRYRASHIQHIQKALNLMNLKLTNVISDITGVTGMKIIRAILSGERNPKVLSQFRDRRCKQSKEVIAKSLQGHYKKEQLFVLGQSLELYEFYGHLIDLCDVEIERHYQGLAVKIDILEKPLPTRKVRKKYRDQEPLRRVLYQFSGVDLTEIPAIEVHSAQTILSVIGRDMSKWKTKKHFTSWLGLAPHRDISGGKVLREKTLKTKNRAAVILRQVAVNIGKTDTALGAFYRRISSRTGKGTAVTATARKVAEIIYEMIKTGKHFSEIGAGYYEQKYKSRVLKNLQRKAKSLGLELIPTTKAA